MYHQVAIGPEHEGWRTQTFVQSTCMVSGIGLPIVSGRAKEIKQAKIPAAPKIMKGALDPRNGAKRGIWGARTPPTRADRFDHPKQKLLAGCIIHTRLVPLVPTFQFKYGNFFIVLWSILLNRHINEGSLEHESKKFDRWSFCAMILQWEPLNINTYCLLLRKYSHCWEHFWSVDVGFREGAICTKLPHDRHREDEVFWHNRN